MNQERSVHGYRVMYEKEAEEGVNYLDNRLNLECSKVFFVYAQHYHVAPFEDQNGRMYFLTYENNMYILDRK